MSRSSFQELSREQQQESRKCRESRGRCLGPRHGKLSRDQRWCLRTAAPAGRATAEGEAARSLRARRAAATFAWRVFLVSESSRFIRKREQRGGNEQRRYEFHLEVKRASQSR